MKWQTFFQDLPDFRINRRKRHKLLDILVIALCAVACVADDFEEIEAYGKQKEAFLRTLLDLPNGIPSHDTASADRFDRVFKFLDKVAFGECLYRWSKGIVVFPEDHQRVRSGSAPDDLATIRKLAVRVLGHMEDKQCPKKLKNPLTI